MSLPEPPSEATAPPPKKKWPRSTKIAIAIIGSVVVIGIIGAVATQQPSTTNEEETDGTSSASDSDALVQRTCEIFRDIAADAGEVDSLAETRTRFKDLLNGYGEAAPPDIASPLRGIVSALTNNDVDQLESAVGELDSACSSRGV